MTTVQGLLSQDMVLLQLAREVSDMLAVGGVLGLSIRGSRKAECYPSLTVIPAMRDPRPSTAPSRAIVSALGGRVGGGSS